MAPPRLTLFLDVLSPFAYMAFYLTKNSAAFKKCEITYVPILLGGLIKATGNSAPIDIMNKKDWINIERVRHQKALNIPMLDGTPKPFPQSTVNTQRALCAIEMTHPEKLADSFAALYQAFWVEGKTIGKAEVIAPALQPVLGEAETKRIIEKMTSPEAKKRLLENTELSMAEGAFGLPWFVATNAQGEKEAFWGVDHMGQVLEHLGLDRKDAPSLRAML